MNTSLEYQLFNAVTNGNVEEVKVLLDAGADIEVMSINNVTILMVAAYRGYVEVVKVLLDAGADIEATNIENDTALISSASEGHVEVVKVLLDAGADIEVMNINNVTVLMVAASRGYVEVVKVLLDAGADIEATNIENDTALIAAASEGHVEVVRILLDAGAPRSFPIDSSWDQRIINLLRRPKFGGRRNNCDELSGEIRVLKTLLNECNVSKTALKDQLGYMEEEIADISSKMTRIKGMSVNDKRDIEMLKGIKATLEEKIGLLNKAVDVGTLDKARLVKEITTLKKEIVRLSSFSDSRDNTGDREESIPRGFECVKPFKKSKATRRSRLDSCVPVEGGIFDNIRTTDGGRFTNKQKCIEVCHTDD